MFDEHDFPDFDLSKEESTIRPDVLYSSEVDENSFLKADERSENQVETFNPDLPAPDWSTPSFNSSTDAPKEERTRRILGSSQDHLTCIKLAASPPSSNLSS